MTSQAFYTAKAPLRVSLLGGGADFKQFIEKRPRFIIGSAVKLFIHVNAYHMPSILDKRTRLQYSKVEEVVDVRFLEHKAAREILGWKGISGLNISIASDMPGGCGLGSSSTFSSALLSLCSRYKGIEQSPNALFRDALYAEQILLSERVGCQDQIFASIGGFRMIRLESDGFVDYSDKLHETNLIEGFAREGYLVFTGILRRSSQVSETAASDARYEPAIEQISDIAEHFANEVFKTQHPLELMKSCIREAWGYKQAICMADSVSEIGSTIDKLQHVGCKTYKLLGAGGGGFIFCFLDQPQADKLKELTGSKNIYKLSPCFHGARSRKVLE
jgi:D-glycero-alpha-D-manno-heptose-7-phosphate kinase